MRRRVLLLLATGDRSRFWESIVLGLAKRENDVVLATMSSWGRLHSFARDHEVPAYALGARSRAGFVRATPPLRELVALIRPDVVHAHETLPALSAGASLLGTRRPAVIYHRHHGHGTWRHRPFSAAAGRLATMTLAVSESSRRSAVVEDLVRGRGVVVAYNGIPPLGHPSAGRVEQIREELRIREEDAVIVVIGRLRPEKGHAHLIRSLGCLPESLQARLHLVVVGSGPEEARLRAVSATVPSPVHFVGHQDDVAVWAILGDVIALPSLQDACPLTALEAMSLGRPIVASAVGGIPELLEDEVSALLVPPADPRGLATALQRLLADSALRARIGLGAKTVFEGRFTLDHMLDSWESAYDFVCDRNRVTVELHR